MNLAENSTKGRKHCEKRIDFSLRAISPFPVAFSEDLYCRHVKIRAQIQGSPVKTEILRVVSLSKTEMSFSWVEYRKFQSNLKKETFLSKN